MKAGRPTPGCQVREYFAHGLQFVGHVDANMVDQGFAKIFGTNGNTYEGVMKDGKEWDGEVRERQPGNDL
jgi:hypothetical protein